MQFFLCDLLTASPHPYRCELQVGPSAAATGCSRSAGLPLHHLSAAGPGSPRLLSLHGLLPVCRSAPGRLQTHDTHESETQQLAGVFQVEPAKFQTLNPTKKLRIPSQTCKHPSIFYCFNRSRDGSLSREVQTSSAPVTSSSSSGSTPRCSQASRET